MSISVVIPTYQRELVLLETLREVLLLVPPAAEVLVADQTPKHEAEVEAQLLMWNGEGRIRWIRLEEPSIPKAMNTGLSQARQPLVLFLDDDIRPHSGLVSEHARAHREKPGTWATVGQVLQPWQKAEALVPPRKQRGLEKDFDFLFHSTLSANVENVMAGNLCVNRERALSIGGFDENFIGAAYRFETDFARRVIKAGGRIHFVAAAGIDHLRAESGGTRSAGSHLNSASPDHGFGDYYYAFKQGKPLEAWVYSLNRMFREVRTKFHLTHPWWIPVKLLGEVRALSLARQKVRQGPKLLQSEPSV